MKKSLKRKVKVYEYVASFEANEDNGYTVTVPALPGLVTEGDDLEHARRMAEEAIQCYIEGLRKLKEKIPFEREIAHIRLSVRV